MDSQGISSSLQPHTDTELHRRSSATSTTDDQPLPSDESHLTNFALSISISDYSATTLTRNAEIHNTPNSSSHRLTTVRAVLLTSHTLTITKPYHHHTNINNNTPSHLPHCTPSHHPKWTLKPRVRIYLTAEIIQLTSRNRQLT